MAFPGGDKCILSFIIVFLITVIFINITVIPKTINRTIQTTLWRIEVKPSEVAILIIV